MKLVNIAALFIISSRAMVINHIRNKVLQNQKGKCALCYEKFNPCVPHEIHHLNHNNTDNNFNNLIALCCNCHRGHHRYGIPVYPYFSNKSILKRSCNMPNFYEEFY